MELEFATVPATWLKPGMHLVDARLPMGNRIESAHTLYDGRVVVIARKRDDDRTCVSYTGASYALVFRPGKLVEVWDRAI